MSHARLEQKYGVKPHTRFGNVIVWIKKESGWVLLCSPSHHYSPFLSPPLHSLLCSCSETWTAWSLCFCNISHQRRTRVVDCGRRTTVEETRACDSSDEAIGDPCNVTDAGEWGWRVGGWKGKKKIHVRWLCEKFAVELVWVTLWQFFWWQLPNTFWFNDFVISFRLCHILSTIYVWRFIFSWVRPIGGWWRS